MNFFKRFRHFICISLCIVFIFTFSQFSKPKEVKAIEPVATLSFATYLLVGGLATMCGVKFASIPKEARYDFISGGFEAIKNVANWGFDGQGLATKLILNEATIKAFLNYVDSKENSSIMTGVIDYSSEGGSVTLTFPCPNTLSNSQYSISRLIGSISGKFTLKDFCYYNVNYNGILYIYTITNCSGMSSSGYNGFYLCDSPDFSMIYDPYAHYDMINDSWYTVNCTNRFTTGKTFTVSATGTFTASVGDLNKTVVYPKNLTDVRGIEDYTKQWDKTNVGQQSIEVDGTKTGVDVSTPIEGSNSLTDDIVFPGIDEGVEVPGLKINTGEGSIEASPDTSKDDTLEHQSILQDILDWIGSLFLSLFKFLLDLLEKLIQLLKELLISLFVPSDAFVQEKVDILKNQLEPKLPYAQYIKLFDSSYEGNELKDIIINIYGQDVVIVKVTLFERFRDLFNTGVYAVMFFLLAIYNYNNIYKLIRGTDYVSATNTINNATGGTGGSGKGGGD